MTVHMSRDSRKVVDLLGSVCTKHGLAYTIADTELYALETTMCRYFAAPVINLLRRRIAQVRKFESKHGTMEYWMPVIYNMLKDSSSAVRDNVVTILPVVDAPSIYWHIVTEYLLTDYSHEDMNGLMMITSTYTYGEVRYACMVGKANKVYEVRYIKAVLEKERAKKDLISERMGEIASMIGESRKFLDGEVHEHGALDMAQVEYSWQSALEGARLTGLAQRLDDDEIRKHIRRNGE